MFEIHRNVLTTTRLCITSIYFYEFSTITGLENAIKLYRRVFRCRPMINSRFARGETNFRPGSCRRETETRTFTLHVLTSKRIAQNAFSATVLKVNSEGSIRCGRVQKRRCQKGFCEQINAVIVIRTRDVLLLYSFDVRGTRVMNYA